VEAAVKSRHRQSRIVLAFGMLIGLLVALGIPGGYFVMAWNGETRDLAFKAQVSAERLAKYAYATGLYWRYSEHRLETLLAFSVHSDSKIRQTVLDRDGNVIAALGKNPKGPLLTSRLPIEVHGEVDGWVGVETSLRPILLETVSFSLIGAVVGAVTFAFVYFLPLRALNRTSASLARAQERLEQSREDLARERVRADLADRSRSEFLANMSHELRTPLNAINGFAETLIRQKLGPLGDARYAEYARDIYSSGMRLLEVINDLLDMARIESGKFELNRGPADPLRIAVASVRLVDERAAEAGVHVSIEKPEQPLPRILVDGIKVGQILLNLLSNAVKFTSAGGVVVLGLIVDGEDIVFEVTDTGIGMNEDQIETALQPFGRIGYSHNQARLGVGLGLSLAKALTELHGGHLTIASRLGVGTTVAVRLPMTGSRENNTSRATHAG